MDTNLSKKAQRHHDDACFTLTDLMEHDLKEHGSIELEHMMHLAEDGKPLLSGLFAFEDDDEKDMAMAAMGSIWGAHPTADTLTLQMDSTLTEATGEELAGSDVISVVTVEFQSIGEAALFNRRATIIRYWVEDGRLNTEDVTDQLGVNDMPSRTLDIIERLFSAVRANEPGPLDEIPTEGYQRLIQAVGYAMERSGMVFFPLPDFEMELVTSLVEHYGAEQFAEARRQFEPLLMLTPHVAVVDNTPQGRRN